MPLRITLEAMAAALAAGEPPPPREASTRPDVYRQLQADWLAVAMPRVVLPHEPFPRNQMWEQCKAKHSRAIKAAAVREEALVDLRPPSQPWRPEGATRPPDEANKEHWYKVHRQLRVSDRWRADKCPGIGAINVFEPELTPTGTRARRRIEATLEAGSEDDGESERQQEVVVDYVYYTFGERGRASAQDRRRDKETKREKDCLLRMHAPPPRRSLWPSPIRKGHGGGPRARLTLRGALVPAPHVAGGRGGGASVGGGVFGGWWSGGGGGGGGGAGSFFRCKPGR